MSDAERKLLAKGFNCFLLPEQLNYADFLVYLDLFYINIFNLEILSEEEINFVKTKTKETVLSSFRQYNKTLQLNLSKEEITV